MLRMFDQMLGQRGSGAEEFATRAAVMRRLVVRFVRRPHVRAQPCPVLVDLTARLALELRCVFVDGVDMHPQLGPLQVHSVA